MSHENLSNAGVLGVTVRTWGTKASKGNGMLNFMDQQLFGGDVGHASINMKLPINETTKKWIEAYCCKETHEQYQAKGWPLTSINTLGKSIRLFQLRWKNKG